MNKWMMSTFKQAQMFGTNKHIPWLSTSSCSIQLMMHNPKCQCSLDHAYKDHGTLLRENFTGINITY
uniref:Uncharacterized protein n=1 Tax=Rhizophora mucronata TaxID=61149 RepID=A0A2P2KKL1_RHIMU